MNVEKKITVLVSGSTGQLGQELRAISKNYPILSFTFKDRKALDLSSEQSIKKNLRNSYNYFINAGAYTAVDKAEKDKKNARIVNATALKYIAEHASPKTKLIHISSDYVYHTNPGRPLTETDKTNPQGIYAKTKLAGENHLLRKRPDALVIRTSWVYSSFGNNFVKTMLRLGKKLENLNIVADQYGAPTYARDLAECLVQLILREKIETYNQLPKQGVFNYSNHGLTNWSEFAKEIFTISKTKCTVGTTTTKAFNAPAPRPLWSMMSKEKIQENFHLEIPHWKKSLRRCLEELGY